jgi:ERCC4-type nuclease
MRVIHCDTREPKSMRMLVSAATQGDVTEHPLPSADYVIFCKYGCTASFERKAGNDLTGSMSRPQGGTTHLTDTLARMATDWSHRFLIWENPPEMNADKTLGRSGWSHASVQMILYKWAQQGVHVFYTHGPRETADLLRVMNDRAKRGCVTGESRVEAEVVSSAA